MPKISDSKQIDIARSIPYIFGFIKQAYLARGFGLQISLADLKRRIIEQATMSGKNISAHEIGTPLTIIKGNVEMLMDGNFGKVNEIQKKRFRVINNNVERINTLSKDSLILTKIDSKNLKLIKRKSSISKLTYDIVEEMKPLAFQKNQNIKFDLKDEIKASFDRTTITQVINNLLSNAIKYTKNKGRIHVALENGNKDIHLLVKDNGIGISKKEHEKIFERFYMVENHLHHKDGSGLGLAIVKEIIELHNGKVWVESKKNKGTTFHFTIPAK